jgi:hypothetical protein
VWRAGAHDLEARIKVWRKSNQIALVAAQAMQQNEQRRRAIRSLARLLKQVCE